MQYFPYNNTCSPFSLMQSLSDEIKPYLSYLPEHQQDRVLHALKTAYHAHSGQRRRSGEPFVNHPIAVMKILAGYHVDTDTLVAGLLHVRSPTNRDDLSSDLACRHCMELT